MVREDTMVGRMRWRIAGAALIGASLGAVVAMGHHPTAAQSGGTGGVIHGVLILCLALTAFGFGQLCLILNIRRPGVLAGLVAYAIGVPANVGAAAISGFIVPALAKRGLGATSPDIFLLSWETNQTLAWIGVFASGTAFMLWSVELVCRSHWEDRALGALGLLAGSLPIALLASGKLDMTVAGASAIYAFHLGWAALVGLYLWRGRSEAAPSC